MSNRELHVQGKSSTNSYPFGRESAIDTAKNEPRMTTEVRVRDGRRRQQGRRKNEDGKEEAKTKSVHNSNENAQCVGEQRNSVRAS